MENPKATQQTLQFASVAENIALVENLIDNVCKEYSINEDFYGNILISLTEAVNNAIHHGNKQDPDKDVKVSFIHDDNLLRFIIEDEGEGFDFENLPDPTAAENLEKISGRGVFLMKNLTDEVSFDNEGSSVELKFNL